MEYAELHINTGVWKYQKRQVITIWYGSQTLHLSAPKTICHISADYGLTIQYIQASFLKNKLLSFEEWVSRSSIHHPLKCLLIEENRK